MADLADSSSADAADLAPAAMADLADASSADAADMAPAAPAKPVFPGEAEIALPEATLTSSACTGPALALDDDPATAAVFGAPPAVDLAVPYSQAGPIPGNYWPTPAACEAANAGEFVSFAHGGGPIGVWTHDGNYPDNVAGSPNPAFALALDSAPGAALAQVTPDIFSSTVAYFGGGQSYPAGTYRVSYAGGSMKFQNNIAGWTTGNCFVHAASAQPRFLRVDWGYDVFLSRVRLAYSGPGAGSVGVDYESSLSADAGHTPPLDVGLAAIPGPADPTGSFGDGALHEVVFNPPVLARGIVFFPDALRGAPSSQPVILSQLQVYQDVSQSQGVLVMPNPTTNQARVGCSGAVITPRFYTSPTSYPFPQTAASVLRSIQGLSFSSAVKLARETGGETVHQINGYETDREIKCKISVERYDYLALQNFLSGTLVVNPANPQTGLQETQYHAPNYGDRAPYFSLVAQSVNGDPSALFVLPKCKIDGSLTADLERDKTTMLDVDFVLFWDYNYTRQDGTLGGISEQIFNNGGVPALHS